MNSDLLGEIDIHPVSSRNLHSDLYMQKVREDLPGFLKRYFNFPDDEFPEPDGTVPHVIDQLQQMFKGGKYVSMWATDHCKSLTGTFFFPIVSLAENPDEAHIICCANEADSKRRLQNVERYLEGSDELSRKLIEDYPWLRKPDKPRNSSGAITWSRKEFTVAGRSPSRHNPSCYAATVEASDVRQRRGKIILDDVESRKERFSALKRRQLYEFVKYEAMRCLEGGAESKRPLGIAMGTPFDVESVYLRLEQEGWETTRVPAYTVDYETVYRHGFPKVPISTTKYRQTNFDDPWQLRAERLFYLRPHFFTWRRKWRKVTENDPRFGHGMTRAQFLLNYMLDPSAGDPTRLTLQEMQRLIRETQVPEEEDWLTLVSIDPASGSDSRLADYTGISVVRIRWPNSEPLPWVQVLEAHAFEQGIIEQVDFAAELAQKYQCKVIYEVNSQQGGNYANIFQHRAPGVVLLRHFTQKENKDDTQHGLTIVRTLIKQQRLLVPQTKMDEEGIQKLLGEIRDLGMARAHDHIAASVWFVIRYVFDQVRQYNGPKLLPMGSTSRAMWGSGQMTPSWRTWKGR